jgi:hypothetical protein
MINQFQFAWFAADRKGTKKGGFIRKIEKKKPFLDEALSEERCLIVAHVRGRDGQIAQGACRLNSRAFTGSPDGEKLNLV